MSGGDNSEEGGKGGKRRDTAKIEKACGAGLSGVYKLVMWLYGWCYCKLIPKISQAKCTERAQKRHYTGLVSDIVGGIKCRK